MKADRKLDDPVAEEAVAWMVEFMSGEMTEARKRAFEAWLTGGPEREHAWIRLQGGLHPYGVASRTPAVRDGLMAGAPPRRSRRAVLGAVAGLLGLGGGLAVADRFVPLPLLLADRVTRTGERRRVVLADSSVVDMAPRSAVDLGSTDDPRRVRLREGRVLASVVRAPRRFVLDAPGLTLNAAEGRFVLEARDGRVSATAIAGQAGLAVAGEDLGPLEPGTRFVADAAGSRREPVDIEVAAGWTRDLLIARGETVADIVRDLRPYFPGVIRFDPAVGGRRATGVFRLDQPGAAVAALAASLDLQATFLGPYWIDIGPRSA